MNRKNIYTLISAILLIVVTGVISSCTQRTAPDSDNSIRFNPTLPEGFRETKAYIYQGTELPTSDENFYFHIDAYLADKDGSDGLDVLPYFSSDVKYLYIYNDQDQIQEWRFCNITEGGVEWVEYYYPQTGESIDLFGYVRAEYVTVKEANPPTFSVEMPLTDNQSDVKEFMYAYSPGQTKDNNPVQLNFIHPFAAVRFVVKQSHRNLIINKIGFKNLKNKATCSLNPANNYSMNWSFDESDNSNPMEISVGKTIPDDINFGGPIGDTYLVLPQTFDSDENAGIKLFVDYTWNNNDNDNTNDNHTPEILLHTLQPEGWSPGYIYTYAMNLGNSAEEISFKVTVEPWVKTYSYTYELE